MDLDRLEVLYDRHADRALTGEEEAELVARLGAPEARRHWRLLATVEGKLQEEFSAVPGELAAARPARHRWSFGPRPSPSAWLTGLAAAGVFAAAVLLLSFFAFESPGPRSQAARPAPPEEEPPPPPAKAPAAERPLPLAPETPAPRVDPLREPTPLPPPTPPAPKAPEPAPAPPAPPPARETVAAVTIAEVERVLGQAFLAADGVRAGARERQAVPAGTGIETKGRSSGLVLRFKDGTRLEVRGDTEVRDVTEAGGKRVALLKGEVRADVARQAQPMVLTTPHGEARVLGTQLRLSAGDVTRLEVREGKVRLTRHSDGKAVDVGGGHFAVAGVGVELVARPVPALLFSDTFNASPVGQWPPGWGRHPREAATRSGWQVLADPARPGERYIACPAPAGLTQHAMIPLPEWEPNFILTFRLRMSGKQSDRAGVEFDDGRQDPSFQYDAKASTLEVDWPRGTVLKQAPLKLAPGAWSDWAVTARGHHFLVAVDGRPALQMDVPGFGSVINVGLVSKGADSAHFDDVKVQRLR